MDATSFVCPLSVVDGTGKSSDSRLAAVPENRLGGVAGAAVVQEVRGMAVRLTVARFLARFNDDPSLMPVARRASRAVQR